MKYSAVFVLAMMILGGVYSQPWMSLIPEGQRSSYNFYDVQSAFEQYWQNKEVERSKGWKQFKRWEAFMEPRVFPTGVFPQEALYEQYREMRSQRSVKNLSSSAWTFIGPDNVPYGNLGYPSEGIGRLNCVAFHPANNNIMWVGAPAGGIWKTEDGGQTWSTSTDELTNLGISDIAVNPQDHNIMYCTTGDADGTHTYSYGILKSTDGGVTWNGCLNLSLTSFNSIKRILINPDHPDTLISATSAGIYVSYNGGSNWYNKQAGNFKDIEFKPFDPNIVYAASSDYWGESKVYKSSDAGNTWTQLTSGLPTAGVLRIELAVTPIQPSTVYALCSNADDGFYGLYKSTNAGSSWSLASSSPNILSHSEDGSEPGGQAYYDLALAVSPSNANLVFAGGVNIWKSTNGGASWTISTHWYGGGGAEFVHADQHMLKYNESTGALFTCSDGGLQKTTNSGTSWSDLSDGLHITQFYRIGASATNQNLVIGGTQDNGTNIYNTGSWTKAIGGDGMECLIDHYNANIMFGTVYYGSIYKSSNGGSYFADITPSSAGQGAWVTPFVMDPTNHNILYGGYEDVYKTTNGGNSWSAISSGLTGGDLLHSLAIAPSDPSTIYVATYDQMWRTNNGGTTWTSISTGLPAASISSIAVNSSDPAKVYITFSGYVSNRKVYYSETGGSSWINMSQGLANIPVNCIIFDQSSASDAVYIGTDLGVYFRDANYSSWQPYSEGLPNVIVNDLEIQYTSKKLIAGTFGRGMWSIDLLVLPDPPVVDFSSSANTVIVGNPVSFTDLSTNNPDGWAWIFQGGTPTTSSDSAPTIVYNIAGTFDVTLQASNQGGTGTLTKQDYITVIEDTVFVVADFSAVPTVVSEGEDVMFTDLSEGSPNSWQWVFDGGAPSVSTEQNPLITYTTPGTYSVTLTATNTFSSDAITKTAYITVVPFQFTADFAASSTVVLQGGQVDFTDLSNGTPIGWYWTFQGGSPVNSFIQNPTGIVYNTPGSYTVSLNSTDGSASDTETKTAYITVVTDTNQLVADFYADFTTIYAGQSVSFTDNSYGNPIGWYWTFSGGNPSFSTSQNPQSIVYSNPGSYAVTLNITNGSGSDNLTRSAYITVLQDPNLLVADFEADNTTVYVGDQVSFNDLTSGNPTGWYWTFSGGTPLNSTDQNPSGIIYNQAGTYNVSLNATDESQSDTENKSAYITVLPAVIPLNAEFAASSNQIIEGQSIDFIDLSEGAPVEWNWSFEGGTPGNSVLQNPTGITYPNPGLYAVTLTVFDGSQYDTESKTGFIKVDSSSAIVELNTEDLCVFPNPANEDVFVVMKNNRTLDLISVFNSTGELVEQLHYNRSSEVSVSVKNFSEGLYFFVVQNGSDIYTVAIMVAR